LGLLGLPHEVLGVAGGDSEDLQDVRVEIPRRLFGFEGGQPPAEFHRLLTGARLACRPQRMDTREACLPRASASLTL
jgi:hypothetical protein